MKKIAKLKSLNKFERKYKFSSELQEKNTTATKNEILQEESENIGNVRQKNIE